MLIFEETLIPSPFMEPSLTSGPHSPWCEDLRMRKGLTRVCKRWRPVALHFLYRDVTLRRAGQLFTFARTVQASNLAIAPLVRAVSFALYTWPELDADHMQSLISQFAADVLKLCPKLSTLRFAPDFLNHYFGTNIFSSTEDDERFAAALRGVGPRISALHFDDIHSSISSRPFTYPVQFISLFPNLRSVTWSVDDTNGTEKYFALRFEKLEELKLDLQSDTVQFQLRSVASWDLPVLKRVGVRFSMKAADVKDSANGLYAFFESHGANLRELTLSGSTLWTTITDPSASLDPAHGIMKTVTDRILALCPELSYICIPPWYSSTLMEELIARNPPPQMDVYGDIYILEDSASFSNVRLIDNALLHLPDLPRFLLRPLELERSQPPPVVHRIHRFHIIQTSFAVYPLHSPDWNDKLLLDCLGDLGDRVKLKRWISGLPEFDSDQRVEYAYAVDIAGHCDQDEDGAGSYFIPDDLNTESEEGPSQPIKHDSGDDDVEDDSHAEEDGENAEDIDEDAHYDDLEAYEPVSDSELSYGSSDSGSTLEDGDDSAENADPSNDLDEDLTEEEILATASRQVIGSVEYEDLWRWT